MTYSLIVPNVDTGTTSAEKINNNFGTMDSSISNLQTSVESIINGTTILGPTIVNYNNRQYERQPKIKFGNSFYITNDTTNLQTLINQALQISSITEIDFTSLDPRWTQYDSDTYVFSIYTTGSIPLCIYNTANESIEYSVSVDSYGIYLYNATPFTGTIYLCESSESGNSSENTVITYDTFTATDNRWSINASYGYMLTIPIQNKIPFRAYITGDEVSKLAFITVGYDGNNAYVYSQTKFTGRLYYFINQIENNNIPDLPTVAGTYSLTATVTSGQITYSWT